MGLTVTKVAFLYILGHYVYGNTTLNFQFRLENVANFLSNFRSVVQS